MDDLKMFKESILKMFKEGGVSLTDTEAKFLKITSAGSAQTFARVMSEMYSVKHAEKNTNALIDSNKRLAESTEKHTKSMRYLTGALVGVALLQVIVAIIALL